MTGPGAVDDRSWQVAGLWYKAVRRPGWNQNLHPRDSTGKFIQNGDPVLISGTVGGGRGTVIGARGGLISVRLPSGRVVNVARDHLKILSGVARPVGPVRPAPAVTAEQPARAVESVRPETFAHPATGEPVAPVKDRSGTWRMVNPKLIDRDGTPHVRTFDLAGDGTVGASPTLRPTRDIDLASAGKFPGTPKAKRHIENTARAGDGATDRRFADDRNTLAEPGAGSARRLLSILTDRGDRAKARQVLTEARRQVPQVPLVALNAEETQIAELIDQGWSFRTAYAEVFNMKPDELAELERSGRIDVDRIAGRILAPEERQLFREFVYLDWLMQVGKAKGLRRAPIMPNTKTAPQEKAPGLDTEELQMAALAGHLAATADLPITVCPYDANGDPAQRALALAFVRAYTRRLPPTPHTLGTRH